MFMSIVVAVLPLTTMAQDDDMYFVPSKAKASAAAVETPRSSYTPLSESYYPGSSRDIDEYNRRGSSYEVLPADTGDIISFAPVEGVYPDSVGDFKLTRKMSRWEGYEPSEAYIEGYRQGRNDSFYWHSPWYYSYYPWYDSWYYDPWYYSSWHYGWYDPWYYGSWGWRTYYDPWYYDRWYRGGYWGGGYVVSHNRHSGANYRSYAHGSGGGRYGGGVAGTRKSSRYNTPTGSRATTATGTRTTTTTGSRGVRTATSSGSYGSTTYGPRSVGSRSTSGSTYTPSSSGSSVSSSRSSGGSFGGGGGSFGGGGSRAGGGGGGSRSGGSRR